MQAEQAVSMKCEVCSGQNTAIVDHFNGSVMIRCFDCGQLVSCTVEEYRSRIKSKEGKHES